MRKVEKAANSTAAVARHVAKKSRKCGAFRQKKRQIGGAIFFHYSLGGLKAPVGASSKFVATACPRAVFVYFPQPWTSLDFLLFTVVHGPFFAHGKRRFRAWNSKKKKNAPYSNKSRRALYWIPWFCYIALLAVDLYINLNCFN